MADFQREKQIVLAYFDAMEQAAPEEAGRVLSSYAAENYDWKGSYPFRSLHGAAEVADAFWIPLKEALSRMQRRQDIFIAGHNALCPSEVWVMSMGNFMGNFTGDFLGIRHTGKLITLRYVEFAHVEHEKIRASGIFVDLIGFMAQAGVNPLPKMEGACFVYPGPREHDGLLYEDADEAESKATLQLIAAIPNADMLEYCAQETVLSKSLVRHHFRLDKDGNVAIPDLPGLGIELNTETLERYRRG